VEPTDYLVQHLAVSARRMGLRARRANHTAPRCAPPASGGREPACGKVGLFSSIAILIALVMAMSLPGACVAQGTDTADLTGARPPAGSIWLDSMDLGQMDQDWGSPRGGHSVENNPLTLNGVVYAHGVGTHARSVIQIALDGSAIRFVSMVGVDDEKKGAGSVTFAVYVDGKKVTETGILHGGDTPRLISVDITGAKTLRLVLGDGGDGIDSDHGDWAGAQLTLAPGAMAHPRIVAADAVAAELPRIVIPMPDPRPALHGPSIVGATPGKPFLFLIPATGDAPLTFSAKHLPPGLVLDSRTGIVTGALKAAGQTVATITVSNAKGTATRHLTIVGGVGKLALTPPMGWKSWNCWAGNVSDARVKAAADAFISSGLAAHGYQYVNIDDTWEGKRDALGQITSNGKFPDMPALAAYVHQKGLKIGLYSSPGPKTCGGFEASYQHEAQDAQTYAAWGFNYLKYDWCSYGDVVKGQKGPDVYQKPYALMSAALRNTNRDIVFSLCQYGMGNVWTWGDSVGGNCWRTTGDITDRWSSLHKIYESQNGHEKFAGPGHWNDPDMLVVGQVGWGRTHPSHLTANEQILHMTMWCLLSAPLLIGCDLANMDDFTRAILTNDEALDINQDPLGKPAGQIAMSGDIEIWARPLSDGAHAVGLINPTPQSSSGQLRWSDLGLKGRQRARDLWLHKDLGLLDDSYTVTVPAHGAVLLKIGQ